MSKPINPYVAGHSVGETDTFIGREELLGDVLRMLANPDMNAIVLYGQRRTGKTSLLEKLRHLLQEKDAYISIYFNLEDKADLPIEQLLTELAQAITAEIDQTSHDTKELKELAQTRLTRESFRSQFLPQAFKAFSPNSLVLLFDEFDVLGELQLGETAQGFFAYLRELMDVNQQRLQFVFAIGRQFEDWSNLIRNIFEGVEIRRVSTLTYDETVRLIRLSEQNESLVWPETAINRVWALTSGHPYLTQQLCAVVWDSIYPQQSELNQVLGVLPEMVDAAIGKLFERSASALEWIWDGLPPAARFVASLLAEAESDVVSQEELEAALTRHGVEVIMHQLSTAPQTLKEWDVIEEVNGGYRFRVELLRQWLLRYKPLNRVREELERFDAIANARYQLGKEQHQAGELTQAARLLRLAVQINPNHMQAHLELGKVLLKQEEISEAMAELNVAYKSGLSEAKSEYINALLKVAQSPKQTYQKRWQACQQILQIQANHSDALRVRNTLLQQREQKIRQASEYEKAEKWAAAIQIYEQLLADVPEEKERWQDALQQAHQQQELQTLYQQARQALADGEREQGMAILYQLLSRQQDYKQAQKILLQASSGEPLKITAANKEREGGADFIKWGMALISLLLVAILAVWAASNNSLFNLPSDTPIAVIQDPTSTVMPTVERATVTLEPTVTASPESKTLTPEPTLTTAATETSTAEPIREDQFSNTAISESPDDVVVLLRLTEHTGEVWSVDFSPDGYILASGGDDNQIRFWDVDTGHLLLTFTDTAKVWSVEFSPDGEFLASGSEDSTIHLWDINSSDVVQAFSGHTRAIRSLAFDPDGTRIASGSDDNTVRLWDLATGNMRQIFSEPTDWVLSVAFSPPAQVQPGDDTDQQGAVKPLLASADADNMIYLWEMDSGQRLQTLTGHTDWVRSIAFSPDGTLLASASDDNTVRLWDLAEGKVQAVLEAHSKSVNSVAFSPDGTLLASGSDDHTIHLWDVKRASWLKTLEDNKNDSGRVLNVAFSPDSTRLASAFDNGTILLWGVSAE